MGIQAGPCCISIVCDYTFIHTLNHIHYCIAQYHSLQKHPTDHTSTFGLFEVFKSTNSRCTQFRLFLSSLLQDLLSQRHGHGARHGARPGTTTAATAVTGTTTTTATTTTTVLRLKSSMQQLTPPSRPTVVVQLQLLCSSSNRPRLPSRHSNRRHPPGLHGARLPPLLPQPQSPAPATLATCPSSTNGDRR